MFYIMTHFKCINFGWELATMSKKSRVRLNVIIRRVFFKLFLHTDFSCITERNVTSFAIRVHFLFCLCYTFAVCIARRHRPCWTTPPWRLQGSKHSGNWGKSRVILQVKAKKNGNFAPLNWLVSGINDTRAPVRTVPSKRTKLHPQIVWWRTKTTTPAQTYFLIAKRKFCNEFSRNLAKATKWTRKISENW